MPRIVAFSPATASSRASLFDSHKAELHQSPALKSQQLKWIPSSPCYRKDDDEGAVKTTKFDFDQDSLVGAFRSFELPTPCYLNQRDDRWVHDLHRLPLDAIAAFLSISDLTNTMLTCHQWRRALSLAPVWRMMYARQSHPQVISRRSHASSWRSLCLSGPRLSITELLSLHPAHCYFDMTPSELCEFSPAKANQILGQPQSPIIACLEILPGFFWNVLQTVSGIVHTGVVTLNGCIMMERGLIAAGSYLAALSVAGWRSLNMRSLALLLVTLQAIPAGVAVSDAIKHTGSFLIKNPFRLVLRFRADSPSVFYFFANPSFNRAFNLAMLPDMLTEALDLDENASPGDSDSFATLQFSKRTNQLVWTGRYSLRKGPG